MLLRTQWGASLGLGYDVCTMLGTVFSTLLGTVLGTPQFMLTIGSRTFDLHQPVIMGILNVTPDSFSDGGRYASCDHALHHARVLIEEGADIIDVGGESTRPGSLPVSPEDELARVIPVIEGIRAISDIPLSIDTQKAAVADRALQAGANMVNDISAGRHDSAMFGVVARRAVPICLMHMQGTPATMQHQPRYDDLLSEISDFLTERTAAAKEAGIAAHNIVIDPGIGFGKSARDNIEIILHINRLRPLSHVLLLGSSRKSFIGKLLGLDVHERLEPSLATLAKAYQHGVRLFRVHDVGPTRRFLAMVTLLEQ